jgi:hypothetical protein
MPFRAAAVALLGFLVVTSPTPVAAKTIEVPVHISVQKSQLSIARFRLGYGRRLRRDVCAQMGAALRAGNAVHVTVYGASNVVITTFTYTKRDCQ